MTYDPEEEREYDAYVASLKPQFGVWDPTDPVVQAILKLVEAQNALATAIDEEANGIDEEEEPHASVNTAVEMRATAALNLLQAMLLGDVWTVQHCRDHPFNPFHKREEEKSCGS
jgi:hypothetical protein